eukprot:gene1315-2533_t
MNTTKGSLMQVESLKPEYEFSVIKQILLRESYLKRLQNNLRNSQGKVTAEVIGTCDVLREISIETIESIRTWERAQITYPLVTPFLWNEEDYVMKMRSDLAYLQRFPMMREWLGFEPDDNPFIVPPEIFIDNEIILRENSYAVFGMKPPMLSTSIDLNSKFNKTKNTIKSTKSPYNAPVINDPDLLPSSSIANKYEKHENRNTNTSSLSSSKGKSRLFTSQEKNSNHSEEKIESSVMSDFNSFETILSEDIIKRIRKCWKYLCTGHGSTTTTNTAGMTPSSSTSASVSLFAIQTPFAITSSPSSSTTGKETFESKDGINKDTSHLTDSNANANGNDTGNDQFVARQQARSLLEEEEEEDSQSQVQSKSQEEEEYFRRSASSLTLALQRTATPAPRRNSALRLFTSDHHHHHHPQSQSQQSPPSVSHSPSFASSSSNYNNNKNNNSSDSSIRIPTANVNVNVNINVNVWTPHDIILQKNVHKRGGDLFAITAAGTKGRTKAPWRRTRLERMETDLEHVSQQSETLLMSLHDLHQQLEDSTSIANSNINNTSNTNITSENVTPTPPNNLTSTVTTSSTAAKTTSSSKDFEIWNSCSNSSFLNINDAINRIKTLYERVKLQKRFLKYQRDHFRKIVKDQVQDLARRNALLALKDGHALQVDEALSSTLEIKSASMIQRQIRRRFGRIFRRNLMQRMNYGALVIQKAWLRYFGWKRAQLRRTLLHLAITIQRVWRGKKCRRIVAIIRYKALCNAAAMLIQRIWRGGCGRLRAKLKSEFLTCVATANTCVTVGLNPALIEDLAEEIQEYLRDYNRNLPIELLTLIRGILFMFNGNEPEICLMENLGMLEKKNLYAKSLSWYGAKKLLRRKGKFLRRLRSLSVSVKSPDASRLRFIGDCLTHLTFLVKNIEEKHFEHIGKGQRAALKLLQFVVNLKRAHDLQYLFSEYFEVVEPHWLRQILELCKEFQKTDVTHRILVSSLNRLQEEETRHISQGLKFGMISKVKTHIIQVLKQASNEQIRVKMKFDYASKKLTDLEDRRIRHLEEIEKAKLDGVNVVKREIEDQINFNIKDDSHMAASIFSVDERTMMHLEARAVLASTRARIARDREQRDFKTLVNFDVSHEKCVELGIIEAELLVLQEKWADFLRRIEGIQYIYDIRDKLINEFNYMKIKINELIARRRILNEEIESDIDSQLKQVAIHCRESRQAMADKGNWDAPTNVEIEGELEEDKTCALAATTMAAANDRETARKVLHTAPAVSPVLLMIDVHIPHTTKIAIMLRLESLNFIAHIEQNVAIPELVPKLQKSIEDGQHIVLYVDVGIHRGGRAIFMAKIRSVLLALKPYPHVLFLDGFKSYRLLNLGRVRHYADIFQLCIREAYKNYIFDENQHENEGNDSTTSTSSSLEYLRQSFTIPDCLFGHWKSPIVPWKTIDVKKGAVIFKDLAKSVTDVVSALCTYRLPDSSILAYPRYQRIIEMEVYQHAIATIRFYDNPARYLLLHWCKNILDLMEKIMNNNGNISSIDNIQDIASNIIEINLAKDICTNEIDPLINKLLQISFEGSLVNKSPNRQLCDIIVNSYRNRHHILSNITKRATVSTDEAKHINIYHYQKEIYLSVEMSNGQNGSYYSFIRVPVSHFIDMLKPTATEMYEGRVTHFDLDFAHNNWINYLSSFTRIEKLGEKNVVRTARSNYMILSRQGVINGYECRIEVIEEVKGEWIILVYGLNEVDIPYKIDIKFAQLQRLQKHSDVDVEREALLQLDVSRVAAIFADRLRLAPAKKFVNIFCKNEMIIDKSAMNKIYSSSANASFDSMHLDIDLKSDVNFTIAKIRYVGGPGRYTGSKVLNVKGTRVIVSVYEVSDDTDVYPIRIIIYNRETRSSVEYQISNLEKMLFFNDPNNSEKTLWTMITERLCPRYYKTIHLKNRAVLGIGEKKSELFHDISQLTSMITYHLGDLCDNNEEGADEVEAEGGADSLNKSVESELNDWSWGLCFSRAVVSKDVENVTISIGLSVEFQCFTFEYVDRISKRQMIEWIPFVEFIEFFKEINDLEQLIRDMQHPHVVSDLLVRIQSSIMLKKGRRNGLFKMHTVQLKGPKGSTPVVIGQLKEHIMGEPDVIPNSNNNSDSITSSNRSSNNSISLHYRQDSLDAFAIQQRLKSRVDTGPQPCVTIVIESGEGTADKLHDIPTDDKVGVGVGAGGGGAIGGRRKRMSVRIFGDKEEGGGGGGRGGSGKIKDKDRDSEGNGSISMSRRAVAAAAAQMFGDHKDRDNDRDKDRSSDADRDKSSRRYVRPPSIMRAGSQRIDTSESRSNRRSAAAVTGETNKDTSEKNSFRKRHSVTFDPTKGPSRVASFRVVTGAAAAAAAAGNNERLDSITSNVLFAPSMEGIDSNNGNSSVLYDPTPKGSVKFDENGNENENGDIESAATAAVNANIDTATATTEVPVPADGGGGMANEMGDDIDQDTIELVPPRKISLTVKSASDIAKTSRFQNTSAACFVTWNGDNVGCTVTEKHNLNPVWDNAFVVKTNEGQEFSSCSLLLDVYDMHGEKRLHFLGRINLSGAKLVQFLDNSEKMKGDSIWLELEKDSTLSDKDNKYVQGRLCVQCQVIVMNKKTAATLQKRQSTKKLDKFFGSKDLVGSRDSISRLMTTATNNRGGGIVPVNVASLQDVAQTAKQKAAAVSNVLGASNALQRLLKHQGNITTNTTSSVVSNRRGSNESENHRLNAGGGALRKVVNIRIKSKRMIEDDDDTKSIDSMESRNENENENNNNETNKNSLIDNVNNAITTATNNINANSTRTRNTSTYKSSSWESQAIMCPLQRIKIVDGYPYKMIRTPLNRLRKRWRFTFPHTATATDTSAVTTATTTVSEAATDDVTGTTSGNIILGSSNNNSQNNINIINDDNDNERIDLDNSEPNKENIISIPTPILKPLIPPTPIRNVEKASFYILKTQNNQSRVCWRACIMPSQISYTREHSETSVLSRKSSRIIHTYNLNELKAIAETYYYDSERRISVSNGIITETATASTFPICVHEILTHDVGLVSRLYRIEIYSNNGPRIGTIDITSNEELARIVGKENFDMICNKDINLPRVFEHIVKNRLKIEFPHNYDVKKKKDSLESPAKDFGWGKSTNEHVAGAIISFITDSNIDDYISRMKSSQAYSSMLTPALIHSRRDIHTLRIFTKWHKLSGCMFLVTVSLESQLPDIIQNTNDFFNVNEELLLTRISKLSLYFKIFNVKTKQMAVLRTTGTFLRTLLPLNTPDSVFFTSRLRRAKLGNLLLNQLHLTYSEYGEYILSFKQ